MGRNNKPIVTDLIEGMLVDHIKTSVLVVLSAVDVARVESVC